MNQQSSGKQKNNIATIIIIIVVIFVVLGAVGYFVTRYLANKALNTITSALPSPNYSASASSDNLGSASWPTDLAISVPEYKKGVIKSVIKLNNPKTWDIIISDTTKADYESYAQELKAAGWTQESEVAFLADISQFQKEQWDLTIAFDPSSNGVKITLVEPVK